MTAIAFDARPVMNECLAVFDRDGMFRAGAGAFAAADAFCGVYKRIGFQKARYRRAEAAGQQGKQVCAAVTAS